MLAYKKSCGRVGRRKNLFGDSSGNEKKEFSQNGSMKRGKRAGYRKIEGKRNLFEYATDQLEEKRKGGRWTLLKSGIPIKSSNRGRRKREIGKTSKGEWTSWKK